MKIKTILFASLWSLFSLVNAQNKGLSPEVIKKFESGLYGVCLRLNDDNPELKAMKASATASICRCASPVTSNTVFSNRINDTDHIYSLLKENYFKCGEAKVEEHLLIRLRSKNKVLNQSQLICLVDGHYKMLLDKLESGATISSEESNRQTELCL